MRVKQERLCLYSCMVGLAFATIGCGDEEADDAGSAPCSSPGEVSGIAGRVVAPSCETTVPSPQVTVFDALQREITSTQGTPQGEFSFAASDLEGDGDYLIRVERGIFTGSADGPVTLNNGRSEFVIVKLEQ